MQSVLSHCSPEIYTKAQNTVIYCKGRIGISSYHKSNHSLLSWWLIKVFKSWLSQLLVLSELEDPHLFCTHAMKAFAPFTAFLPIVCSEVWGCPSVCGFPPSKQTNKGSGVLPMPAPLPGTNIRQTFASSCTWQDVSSDHELVKWGPKCLFK